MSDFGRGLSLRCLLAWLTDWVGRRAGAFARLRPLDFEDLHFVTGTMPPCFMLRPASLWRVSHWTLVEVRLFEHALANVFDARATHTDALRTWFFSTTFFTSTPSSRLPPWHETGLVELALRLFPAPPRCHHVLGLVRLLSDDVFADRGPLSLCSPGRLLVMNVMG